MGRNSSENQSEALLQVKMIIPTPKQLFSTESLRKLIIVLTFALIIIIIIIIIMDINRST